MFPTEIPETRWGANGEPTPLAAILARLGGHAAEAAQALAAQRIAASRTERTRLP